MIKQIIFISMSISVCLCLCLPLSAQSGRTQTDKNRFYRIQPDKFQADKFRTDKIRTDKIRTEAKKPVLPKGPLNIKNRFPVHLMFLTPVPDSPRTIGKNKFKFSFSADYCSVYVNEKSNDWFALIDMEMAVFEFNMEYGLTSFLDLSVDIPMASMSGGFMDDFLGNFHDTFELYNYGKENRPKNDFVYTIRNNGTDWFDSNFGGLHPVDGRFKVKLKLLDEKQTGFFTSSLCYSVKIPMGDENKGFGSGALDHGISLPCGIRMSSLTWYIDPSVSFLSDPDVKNFKLSANTILGLFTGFEYAFNHSWSLLAQANFYTPPFEDTKIAQLDDTSIELSVGAIFAITEGFHLELGFSEDLLGSVPDFNLHARTTFIF